MKIEIPGRPDAANRMQTALEDWKSGKGGLIFVPGEPGMGKSHLLDQIAAAAKTAKVGPVIRVDCTPPIGKVNLASIQPLQPFGKAIEKLYLDGEQAAKKRLVMNIGMSLLASLPIAGDIFYAVKAITQDVSESKPDTAALQYKKRAAVAECIETLERIAKQTPFILLVDDGQWSDPQSVEVLRQMQSRIADMPLLILWTVVPSVAQRSNLPLASLLRDTSDTLDLTELDTVASQDVVNSIDSALRPTDKQKKVLFERSGGTPGILTEYIAYLRHTELVRPDGTIEPEALEQSGVKLGEHPATDVLLHEISSDDAMVLSLCAAEGQEFTAFMVAALMNTDVITAVRTLRRLQHETGVLKSIGMRTRYGVKTTTYEFAQTVAYTYFLHYPEYEERKSVHHRIAEILSHEHDAATIDEVRHQLAAYIAAHSIESEDDELAHRMLTETAHAADMIGATDTAAIIRNDYIGGLSALVLSEDDVAFATSGGSGEGTSDGTARGSDSIEAIIRRTADDIIAGNAAQARERAVTAVSEQKLTAQEKITLLCLAARADIELDGLSDARARLDKAAAEPDIGLRDTCTILNLRAVVALRSDDTEQARSLLHEAAHYASRLSEATRILTLGNILLLQKHLGEKPSDRYTRIVGKALENRSWSGIKQDLGLGS